MKHKQVKQSDFFKIKDKSIEKTGKICDRCGEGTFMAEHEDRWYCGKCKLTVWKKSQPSS